MERSVESSRLWGGLVDFEHFPGNDAYPLFKFRCLTLERGYSSSNPTLQAARAASQNKLSTTIVLNTAPPNAHHFN